jgi:hypothetical protein
MVKSKNQWTIDNKTEYGTFDSYRNKKITLHTVKNNGKVSFDIKRFSYDDQILIRGFVDHQGIVP